VTGKFKSNFFLGLRYYFFAGVAATLDLASFSLLLWLGVDIFLTSFFSALVGILLGYALLATRVFEQQKQGFSLTRYFIVSLGALIFATICVPAAATILQPAWLAKLLWMGFQALVQFQIHKKWTFA